MEVLAQVVDWTLKHEYAFVVIGSFGLLWMALYFEPKC